MSDEEIFLIQKSMIDEEFEIYDAQPDHIRYIMREYDVPPHIAEIIYRKENKSV